MNNLTKEYQYLLTADETIETFDRSLALLEKIFCIEFKIQIEDMINAAAEEREKWFKASEFLEDANRQGFEEMRDRRFKKMERVQESLRVIKTVAFFLKIPEDYLDNDDPLSSYSFKMDALLLLFHQAYFVLLPRLQAQTWENERQQLIHSFIAFSERITSIPEKFRVLGLVAIARGSEDDAANYFMTALNATRVDEHDFMTRLQTVWMHLLDMHHFKMALEILLDIYPRVPRNDIAEVGELIRQTFNEQATYFQQRISNSKR